MRKTACFVLVMVLVLSCAGCSADGEYTDRVIEGEDAYVTLRMSNVSQTGSSLSDEYFDSVAEGCGRLVAKCDKLMSHTSNESQMYTLNHSVDMIVSPDDSLVSVLKSALNIADATDGAYLPTAGVLRELLSADGEPSEDEIAEALKHTDTGSLTVSKEKIEKTDGECHVDLSGISEGFTAQRLLEYLSAADVSYGIVSVGDSVGVFGEKKNGEAFKIGIRSPENTDAALAYYSIQNGFISVSCVNDSYVTIDPTDGCPADSGIVCAAVWAMGGAVSDALSEALTVMGETGTAELYHSRKLTFEAVLINENKEVILTDGIAEENIELLTDGYTVRKITRGGE